MTIKTTAASNSGNSENGPLEDKKDNSDEIEGEEEEEMPSFDHTGYGDYLEAMCDAHSGMTYVSFDIENMFFPTSLTLPPVLREKGLTEEEWNTWMVQELSKVQQMRCGKETEQILCALVLIFYLLVVPVIVWYNRKGRVIRRWNQALVDWQRRFNEECLSGHGVFCKTQSTATRVCCDDIDYERRIVFAYTPAAIERLKQEPHIVGPTNNCLCCWHNPEKKMCMHPEYRMQWEANHTYSY